GSLADPDGQGFRPAHERLSPYAGQRHRPAGRHAARRVGGSGTDELPHVARGIPCAEPRQDLYGAVGFKICPAVDIPAALAQLRLTNPDAPESRHAITLRRNGQPIEVLPYVHLAAETIDPRAGCGAQMRTSWLQVERQQG